MEYYMVMIRVVLIETIKTIGGIVRVDHPIEHDPLLGMEVHNYGGKLR